MHTIQFKISKYSGKYKISWNILDTFFKHLKDKENYNYRPWTTFETASSLQKKNTYLHSKFLYIRKKTKKLSKHTLRTIIKICKTSLATTIQVDANI